jgi:hypothetical protein
MKPMRPVAAPAAPSRPAEAGCRGAGWPPDVADPMMDPVDRVVGLAFFDLAFRTALLTNPAAALAPEPMPLAVKRALVSIRASSVEEFARRAVEARTGVAAGSIGQRRADAEGWPTPQPSYASSLAGAGS